MPWGWFVQVEMSGLKCSGFKCSEWNAQVELADDENGLQPGSAFEWSQILMSLILFCFIPVSHAVWRILDVLLSVDKMMINDIDWFEKSNISVKKNFL